MVGRAELLSAFFFLLSFLSYLVCVASERLIMLPVSILLAAVAMLCKEQGITVLGVCLSYELLVNTSLIQNWQK